VATSSGRDDEIDVLEAGPGTRPRRQRPRISTAGIGLIAAALVVGLVVGYAAGHHNRSTATTPAPAVTPSISPSVSSVRATGPAITQTTQSCSMQIGTRLQLGIEIANDSTDPVTLGAIRARLPLGGLRVVSRAQATCGQLALPPGSFGTVVLEPGATAWVRLTVQVFEACPAPIPVGFNVSYRRAAHSTIAYLPGFPDLGQVHYTGCHTTPRLS
jgi:hypothetical protein